MYTGNKAQLNLKLSEYLKFTLWYFWSGKTFLIIKTGHLFMSLEQCYWNIRHATLILIIEIWGHIQKMLFSAHGEHSLYSNFYVVV